MNHEPKTRQNYTNCRSFFPSPKKGKENAISNSNWSLTSQIICWKEITRKSKYLSAKPGNVI